MRIEHDGEAFSKIVLNSFVINWHLVIQCQAFFKETKTKRWGQFNDSIYKWAYNLQC